MPHLLVVEDDPQLRAALVRALRDRGHAVATAATGMAGLDAAVTHRPDLIVLDLGLPDVDGGQVLRMLRSVSDVPVIVATARDEEPEIVAALEDGADDYIVKPFGSGQLEARIKAVLRRLGSGEPDEPEPPVRVGGLLVAPSAREVTLEGEALELTPREFDLLCYLARRQGQVVSRRELLAEVWQQPLGGADKTVDVHLSWLRRKLGETAQHPRYLHTVRTVGVKLAAPEEPPGDRAGDSAEGDRAEGDASEGDAIEGDG
ncbi:MULTISPECIES: response regulator transcription factor [unclassified Streptomyces]|uniref:response regulator transcription factor n=1 Tax=unclassified Streptomyces TaxID=2593676 RepID=UPI002E166E48|nr:response regulator transcription factor [Streptomyces sp. NBC_01186]WSS42741.1 response regulator transcription factor [Streptomyces sp. NBC_01187]